jgi:cytochrome c-type biogenesis protein CcmH/NrfG
MDVAVALYRRALEIDPRNATALAGLAALSDLTRPEMLEQQLSREIAQHPNSAALHFMLGNVYASQSLWTQAQSAYYEAHRLDPGNPDILHNLAVSLDRLGQPRVAATMYRRTLEATRSQATQFDAAAVQKRLDEIESR